MDGWRDAAICVFVAGHFLLRLILSWEEGLLLLLLLRCSAMQLTQVSLS